MIRIITCFFLLFFTSLNGSSDTGFAKIVSPVLGIGGESHHTLGLFIPVPQGWKLYGPHSSGQFGYPPSIEWKNRENLKTFKFLWPHEETFSFQGSMSSGYRKDTLIPIEIEIKDPGRDLFLEGTVSYLMCEKVCVPKRMDIYFHLPKGPKSPSRDISLFNFEESEIQEENMGLMLIFALIGGFILNFMPCVLPVLSLKLMSLVNKSEDKKMIRVSSFITFIGILASFLILATVSFAFKISGEVFQWGGQFQNPYFLLFMISIIFFFAANLWGIFEVGQGIVYKIPVMNHRTVIADLWNGFVAVFLATPCSAPFLGTALSFTLSQSEGMIFLIFTCMAFGFGFPYILLSILPPSWIVLPKPGIWMKTFKTILGWGMYGTGIWLIWIFLEHISIFPYFLLIVPIGILFKNKKMFWFSFVSLIIIALSFLYFSTPKMSIPFEGEEKIQEHLLEGKTVVSKITAKWCLSCQAIDHIIFQDLDILRIMDHPDVEIVTGDWTKPNPKIESYLKMKNRLGIPLVVIYGPKNKKGITLSEFPSKQEVLNAFQEVGWNK